MAKLHVEPEWVGIAIRWPDGRIDAYELRGFIDGEIRAEMDVDYDRLTGRERVGSRRIHAEFSATEATRWHQGADMAPKQRQAIEPEKKAIEA